MNVFLPGDIARLDQIDPGTCILFAVGAAFHVGVVLEPMDGSKGILDFECKDNNNAPRFQIYNSASFENEGIIRLSRCRIVPSVAPEHLGQGQYPGAFASKALYLTDLGAVVYANFSQRAYKLKLSDGTRYGGDLAYAIHATHWRIEIEDGSGEFITLREFTA